VNEFIVKVDSDETLAWPVVFEHDMLQAPICLRRQ
jgi:hypothetical protein